MDQKNLKLTIELRHELHEHPELSDQEVWTKNHLMEFLKKHTKLEIVDRGLWFYAVYLAGAGRRTVAYRADFDALPMWDEIEQPYKSKIDGVGHKCGHDGHAAILAGTALEVDQNGCESNVYFVFQHAEEVGNGGICCAELMEEKRVEEVFAFHNRSGLPKGAVFVRNGTMYGASKGMEIKLTGVPAHASTPENGKNPALAIAAIVTGIPKFIAPENNKGNVLSTVIQIDLGERAFGCSASKGSLLLTIRGKHEEDMDVLQKQIEELAEEQAKFYGLQCDFSFCDVFPETVNDDESAKKIRETCERMGIPVLKGELPLKGSEDFGYFTKKTKGALFWVGNGETYPPIHSKEFDFNDDIVEEVVDLFKELA